MARLEFINATCKLKIIQEPHPRRRVSLYFPLYMNIDQGKPSGGTPSLKRASRKGTVHLSKMTSAVPTCSPKDLCCEEKKKRDREGGGERKSLSKSPFVREPRFSSPGIR